MQFTNSKLEIETCPKCILSFILKHFSGFLHDTTKILAQIGSKKL